LFWNSSEIAYRFPACRDIDSDLRLRDPKKRIVVRGMTKFLHCNKGISKIDDIPWKLLNDLLVFAFCLAKPMVKRPINLPPRRLTAAPFGASNK